MRFTDAYATCLICSLTRASIMTGKYPAHLYLPDFIAGCSFPYKKYSRPEWQKYLPQNNLAKKMRSAVSHSNSVKKELCRT